ncbi:negative regulator of flagellin synthesis FlgM [Deferribacter desulfuricans SSM1]|uniref:Negative regulator of flagellin synthesis n=1 Tax=Deferribacter desulfuricans (strain DSM 14783 / JCM 11476 / NBRC 101012 / SSM1) TaxID=639282 RepID=D3PA54_DEFDS|nr:flagellar biosynthesis anti-sigma factor FlgM [Deferribacter desulfuricans]BAI81594.1 negative regulator of flagellin synthesis FlgM [Deferribacter desulfuricans SSM1]
MRIEDKVKLGYENLVKVDNKKDVKKDAKSADVKTEKHDRVEISDDRKKVENLKQKVKEASDIRQEKIDQIKKKIESGTYDVSGKKVAEKIVNLAIDNLF